LPRSYIIGRDRQDDVQIVADIRMPPSNTDDGGEAGRRVAGCGRRPTLRRRRWR
jgi:hypothetical protein